MEQLGLILIFVGFALTTNGYMALKYPPKTASDNGDQSPNIENRTDIATIAKECTAVDDHNAKILRTKVLANVLVAVLLLSINFSQLILPGIETNYIDVTSGLLFAFTYVIIAANIIFKLNPDPLGIYSALVFIYAVIISILSFNTGDIFFGVFWLVWSTSWLLTFLEIIVKSKLAAKMTPYMLLFQGTVATFIPGIMMLLGWLDWIL